MYAHAVCMFIRMRVRTLSCTHTHIHIHTPNTSIIQKIYFIYSV